MINLKEFELYAQDFARVWKYFQSLEDGSTYEELCSLRFYQDSSMVAVLKEVGFIKLPDEVDLEPLRQLSSYSELGLETKTGRCLLEGRFVFPVKDMLGNILALIGWYPDEKKYITTPSKYFSRKNLFFGLEQLGSNLHSEVAFVCEGIFDSLSIRSLGYPAYATMGVELSKSKQLLYPLFGREVVGVSDRDRAGSAVRDRDKWNCTKYLTWVGEFEVEDEEIENIRIKDVDDLVKLYDAESLKEVIDEELATSQGKIIKLEV
jgi:DNA primase